MGPLAAVVLDRYRCDLGIATDGDGGVRVLASGGKKLDAVVDGRVVAGGDRPL